MGKTISRTLGTALFMMDVLASARDEERLVGCTGKWKENPSEEPYMDALQWNTCA